MGNRLVICRDIPRMSLLRQLTDSSIPIVLASDDVGVHEVAHTIPEIRSVHFIENNESLYAVATHVRDILARIDAWLATLDPGLPPEVLAWGTNVEGGITNQRVQDVCLLINSYLELFRITDAVEVCLIDSPRWIWEDQVLLACAKARAIPVVRRSPRKIATQYRSILVTIRPWLKAAYYVVHEILRGGGGDCATPRPFSL